MAMGHGSRNMTHVHLWLYLLVIIVERKHACVGCYAAVYVRGYVTL